MGILEGRKALQFVMTLLSTATLHHCPPLSTSNFRLVITAIQQEKANRILCRSLEWCRCLHGSESAVVNVVEHAFLEVYSLYGYDNYRNNFGAIIGPIPPTTLFHHLWTTFAMSFDAILMFYNGVRVSIVWIREILGSVKILWPGTRCVYCHEINGLPLVCS